MKFDDFFRAATRTDKEPAGRDPYPFQGRFAEADPLPHLVRAPTGAGKTATAVLGWLWRYFHSGKPMPRRLVYCLPMRVLVEQSYDETVKWIAALTKAGELKEHVEVHRLMGGIDKKEWYLHPERPAVLIGTQDMLLSRALNRGYAASRFHWPIDFGLLNNDCLWVFDEPQLMASGVSTSAQLAGLRVKRNEQGEIEPFTFGGCPSVWMSATLEPGWLDTVDFRGKFPDTQHELDDTDYDPKRPLHKRMTAAKVLHPLGETATKDGKGVAKAVWTKHREGGGQTLVIVNTVDRAKAVFEELGKLRKKADTPMLLLVHSRFRPAEREALNASLQDGGAAAKDRIIVATQVVEAGVDISSRTLVTELAPWASVVQRIGRCNRTGNDGTTDDPARVFWVNVEERLAPPYTTEDLDFAKQQLDNLQARSVSPKALDDYKRGKEIELPFEHKHVVRRRDVLDLFDTAPDLSGNDIDVARFVRGDDPDTDVQVFWRDIGPEGPGQDEPEPIRRELCNVPVGQARDFIKELMEKKRGTGFVWDHLDGEWVKLPDPKQVRPGQTILLPASAGGYSRETGWDPNSTAAVEPHPPTVEEEKVRGDAAGSDVNSLVRAPRTIAQHTDAVYKAVEACLPLLPGLSDDDRSILLRAARWHDAGKAHQVFRTAMQKLNGDPPDGQHWAKSGGGGKLGYERKHFRHELASALAALQHRPEWPFEVAYLIAAHHGKVRLSIRALPGERPPGDPGTPFALGVVDGDPLDAVDLGDETCPPTAKLDLSPMLLGAGSWTSRALKLRDTIGPFRLAYLEAILRAADQRVSNDEKKGVTP